MRDLELEAGHPPQQLTPRPYDLGCVYNLGCVYDLGCVYTMSEAMQFSRTSAL